MAHFSITEDPDAHEQYSVVEPVFARLDPEVTAAVRRKKDGRMFLRVFSPGVRLVGEGHYHGPGRFRQKLEILQNLRHSNIVTIEEAVITSNGNAGTLYEEILDLGPLVKFAQTNSLGKGFVDGMPIAFGWHVMMQGLRAISYLAYGYTRFQDVIESSGVAPGWDPIVHKRIFDNSVYLKTSGKGKYPTVVLRGFEECRQESEYVTYSAQAPDEAVERFAREQRRDLRDFLLLMDYFLDAFDKREAEPLRELVAKTMADKGADARQMAREFEAEFLKRKVIQEDFPGPLVQPDFTAALELGRPLAPWKRGKKRGVFGFDLNTELSPAGMKFPKSGVIMPEFGSHLMELEKGDKVKEKHKITASIADSYLIDQLAKDREATRRHYPLDKILRDTAKLDHRQAHPFKNRGFLGRGGFGSVTKWTREVPDPESGKKTEQHLAIKDSRITLGFVRDYNAEFYLTRRLNRGGCEDVVRIYDHGIFRPDHDTRVANFRMALEYCNFGSLAGVITFYDLQGLALPVPFIWQVVMQVAGTLTCCENGQVGATKVPGWDTIVHLDLKPQNVLLQKDENSKYKYADAKLADFGLACVLPNDEIRRFKSTYNTGTRGYKDPALADGKPMSSKADIYSFGVMLKKMVQTIYDCHHNYEMILNNYAHKLRHPIDEYRPCPKSLVDLVHKCMNRNPDFRPTAYEIYQIAEAEMNSVEMRETREDITKSALMTGPSRQKWVASQVQKGLAHGLPKKSDWYDDKVNQPRLQELVTLIRKHRVGKDIPGTVQLRHIPN